jgi:hypothetical protein
LKSDLDCISTGFPNPPLPAAARRARREISNRIPIDRRHARDYAILRIKRASTDSSARMRASLRCDLAIKLG